MKKVFKFLLRILKNKYAITILVFAIWISFFDRNDIISKYESRQKLQELRDEKKFYNEAIKKDKEQIHLLKTDVKNLEKFAREEYLMKKDNEDLFIIIDKKAPPKKKF